MDEAIFHGWVVRALIGVSPLVFGALFLLKAGYGRHRDDGWLPDVPARLSWVLMEAPTVFLFLPIYFAGEHAWEPIPLLLMALFQFHYWNRTFVYPTRIRPGAKGAAIWVVAIAVFYQSVNSYVIARWISHFGDYSGWSLADPRLLVGLAVFFAGWWINTDSDRILRNLREPGETGYKIPHGGMYRYVSAPNYLGEMIEWTGFAIASWSLAGLAFAVFTAANLGPRAWANHVWYREKFSEYPPERKAILPFLL